MRYKPVDASFTAVRFTRSALRTVVVASLILAVLALFLWTEADLDRAFLLTHNPLRDNPSMVALSAALSRYGMSVICLLVLACVAASWRFPAFRDARALLVVVLFSFSASTITAQLLKALLGRARPITDLAEQLNVAGRHGSASFPSGHAAQSFGLALPLVLLLPGNSLPVRLAKLALLLVASLVGYSRIVKGAHYLSDVLGGAALAFLCVPLAVVAANAVYARGKVTPEKLNRIVRRQVFALVALAIALPYL